MGDVGNTALSIGSGGLLGDNPISGALGLSGRQGEYYKPNFGDSAEKRKQYEDALRQASQNRVQDYSQTLGLGPNASIEDVASQLGLGRDYQTQLQNEQQSLADSGYGLTQNDREAYGQASGDIARLFGQQEQNLAQSLADRGLGGSFSGVGASQFSGLLGNKNEQLAKAQQAIAQNRMQMNQQRLAQTRNFLSQLSGQRTGLVEGQTDRNINKQQQDVANYGNLASLAAGGDQMSNAAQQASMADKRGAKGQTLLQGLGGGFMSSAYNVGAAPGSAAQSYAGANVNSSPYGASGTKTNSKSFMGEKS